MTESFVTQCPHCRTSFRVNHAQLGAAHGAVRCGACLHVFNAAQQLLEQRNIPAEQGRPTVSPPPRPAASSTAPAPAKPAVPAQVAVQKTQTPPGKAPSDTFWIHDDLDLDGLDLDEELAKLEKQEQQLSQQFLALEQAPKYSEAFNRPAITEPEAHDERWAEALLQESPAPAPLSIAPVDVPATAPPIVPAATPAPRPAAPAIPLPPRSEPAFSLEKQDEPLAEPAVEAVEPALGATVDDADEQQDDEVPGKAGTKAARSEPGLRDDHLFDLDEEPLQLDWQQAKKPWGRWIAWGLLNLIAAGALAGQYINYHFEELARQDRYRPWFEQLCPTVGCTLPSKVDIAQVKSSNLVVRSHPEFSGALVVDAILYNRAQFAQPFPLLEIRFADINGKLLASRRFKPSEYLAGELAGQDEMPPQTPIHVSLDILDPGERAVNYSLSFHSPE
ncbi:DUF3426 domain-containing protein [Pseudomonas borbori]